METEVGNDYIEEALTELISILGTKEPVNHDEIISLIESKKTKEAIKKIALYLGLPIEVNLSYVPNGYRPNNNDGFQSTHLVKTDYRGQGTSSITAQVSIPSNLPLYGTSRMVNFPINVRLSENCAENPASFITVMAHELSHIVLYSLLHKEKENEFYTDLTPMILGFADIMEKGRRIVKESRSTEFGFLSSRTTTHTQTTTYGYLSDENFYFARSEINTILDTKRSVRAKLLKKMHKSQKQLRRTKRLFLHFKKYLDYIDKNLDQKISQNDGRKISEFHQHDYTAIFQSVIKKNEIDLDEFLKFTNNLENYTEYNMKLMQQYEVRTNSNSKELVKESDVIKKDINILKKYVSFPCIIKTKLSLR